MKLTNLLRAAALSVPIAAAMPAEATTGGLYTRTVNCDVSTERFYTPGEIILMNDIMGRMNAWLKQNHTTDASIIKHYVSTTKDSTEAQQDAIGDLQMVTLMDTQYKAGSVEGAVWLTQSPRTPMAAYGAYILHVSALNTMQDTRAAEFMLNFKDDMAWIEGKLGTVQRQMHDVIALCPRAMIP